MSVRKCSSGSRTSWWDASHNIAMNKKELEIMAPAGNFECLMAAIEGGADSVYFGIGQLNMRSHSANHFNI